jgi:RimJ/RimL family protein N-acetyltransferase
MDVCLRPFRAADLELLSRLATDPDFSAPFEWSGFASAERQRQRFAKDGLLKKDPRYLAVAETGSNEIAFGFVTWREVKLFDHRGFAWELGALLAPEARGRGIGTTAQRLLASYLFETTPAHRLVANTEAENHAEQRALEKCGFRREGILRQAGFRGGSWRDVVVYGLLRGEAT